MKKVISIVMAVVMMMAVMVPVFAADLTINNTSGEATVKVDGIADMGEGSYTVSIPATIDVLWGNDGLDAYYITNQLQTGKKVKVTLANTKDLTNVNDANETIVFEVADQTDGLSASAVVIDKEEHKFDIKIAADEWAKASISDYSGTITFTSEIVDA